MIPTQAIEKAIAGGWKQGREFDLKFVGHGFIEEIIERVLSDDDLTHREKISLEEIALDPTFWQTLGKALGWEDDGGKNHDPQWTVEYNVDVEHITAKWLNWQMEFNYLILTGGDTEAFWKELLK